jgi:DNA-binding response OmpR family regulator
MRVLVVEDEPRLAENVSAALREGPGYAVDIAYEGNDAIHLGETGNYDLIILDLMLPGVDGLGVLRRIRSRGQNAPVLVLTAVSGKKSVIELLNAGADDYLGKPFDLGELLARAKALVRRGKGISHPVIKIGRLVLDTLEKTVKRDNVEIELSPTEYRILEYLSHHPRSVISKETLLEHLYDYNWERHSNVIEAHISNLRRKLNQAGDAQWIETLRGRGYRLVASSQEVVK